MAITFSLWLYRLDGLNVFFYIGIIKSWISFKNKATVCCLNKATDYKLDYVHGFYTFFGLYIYIYIKCQGVYNLYSRTKVKIIKLKSCIRVYFSLGHISNLEFTIYWLLPLRFGKFKKYFWEEIPCISVINWFIKVYVS